MTQPDPNVVAATVAAVLQVLQAQQHGMATLAPGANVGRETLLCTKCGMELPGDTWPEYVTHMAANHHSLIERFAADAGVELAEPSKRTPDPHAAAAKELATGDWPVDPRVFVAPGRIVD